MEAHNAAINSLLKLKKRREFAAVKYIQPKKGLTKKLIFSLTEINLVFQEFLCCQ
jgi:hypothetical protein